LPTRNYPGRIGSDHVKTLGYARQGVAVVIGPIALIGPPMSVTEISRQQPCETRTWSSAYRSARFPEGTSQGATFSTTFIFVDANSFLGTTTYTYPVDEIYPQPKKRDLLTIWMGVE
jgi:hypothetical protein